MTMVKFFCAALILLGTSCKESNLKFIDTASYSNLKQERLGESSYYVKFPSTMFIDEARGKEGQLGYGLWEIDSVNRYVNPSGFIEIEHGRPIGWEPDCDISIDKVRSKLLDGTIKWTICKSENGNYYSAIAKHGKLRLEASSRTRSGLDSMISIIATLSSK
jgi:hypothetical protein